MKNLNLRKCNSRSRCRVDGCVTWWASWKEKTQFVVAKIKGLLQKATVCRYFSIYAVGKWTRNCSWQIRNNVILLCDMFVQYIYRDKLWAHHKSTNLWMACSSGRLKKLLKLKVATKGHLRDASKTIQHITAGSKKQIGTACMECHNQAGILYRNICGLYDLEVQFITTLQIFFFFKPKGWRGSTKRTRDVCRNLGSCWRTQLWEKPSSSL